MLLLSHFFSLYFMLIFSFRLHVSSACLNRWGPRGGEDFYLEVLCRENRSEYQKILRGGWVAIARGDAPVSPMWHAKIPTYEDSKNSFCYVTSRLLSHVLALSLIQVNHHAGTRLATGRVGSGLLSCSTRARLWPTKLRR